ncbi:MAG TPA: septum formation initiator family protein [Gemmatimonadales bacterium]
MSRARLAGIAGAVVLFFFALLAGEYSALDWLSLRGALARERAVVTELRVEIDSLTKQVRALETSPAAQERAAREEFGMIRDGERLYRLVPQSR